MPNGREHLKYEDFGPHKYASHEGTSDCEHNCGCWAGPSRSDGPAGVDPLGGKCPGNPLRKILGFGNNQLTTKEVFDDFINARMDHFEQEVYRLRPFKVLVDEAKKGTKIKLQEKVIKLNRDVFKLKYKIERMKDLVNNASREMSSI